MAEAEENSVLWTMAAGGGICFAILHTILVWYIILGVTRQCLYLARGGIGLRAKMLFPPLMMFLKFFGLMLVLQCIYMGILLLFMLPPGIAYLGAYLSGAFADNNFPLEIMIPLVSVGVGCAVAGLCVMTWIAIRLCLAVIFIADRNAGISDAIREAWRVSAGNFWMIFLAMIVLGFCGMLGYFLVVWA